MGVILAGVNGEGVGTAVTFLEALRFPGREIAVTPLQSVTSAHLFHALDWRILSYAKPRVTHSQEMLPQFGLIHPRS